MQKDVLYDAWNENYKKPFGAVPSGEKIEIRFPILKKFKADKVVLIVRQHDISLKFVLKKDAEPDGDYEVFRGTFAPKAVGIYYYRFEICVGEQILFCGKNKDAKASIGDWLQEWQLTIYDKGFHTPNFMKGGIIYHIFVDRFARAGEAKQPQSGVLKDWHDELTICDPDGVYRANDFYGGNLKGIEQKLPYLASLSVSTIYLSPVFKSFSNHRYDTADYLKIDDLLGTEEDFKSLISAAKAQGISIILDGVFNHTGADSIYFNKFNRFSTLGAYQSKQSPYFNWYTFTKFPDEYACWWGVTVVPTVKRDAVGFQKLIAGSDGVLEKWTKLGVAGWRLDVVDELSTPFVEKIRKCLKGISPEILLIGEVWEDASTKVSYGEERQYLFGKELDGVMNYPFKEAILAYLRGGSGEAFNKSVFTIIENYPKEVLDVSMSLIGTHDTVRAINACGQTLGLEFTKAEKLDFMMSKSQYLFAKSMLKIASAMQYMLPGVPSLYYGDEIGMQGFDDPMNRRPFSYVQDVELLEHYQRLGQVRKNHQKEMLGGTKIVAEGDLLTISRGSLHLAVNRTARDIACAAREDLLTQKKLEVVPKRSAVLWEEK